MTLAELNSIVRETSQDQKLVVIEERVFMAGNKCLDDYEETNSRAALTAANISLRTVMQAIRLKQRHFV